jgi:hypothetical protein
MDGCRAIKRDGGSPFHRRDIDMFRRHSFLLG